jgi:hypothetical protein
MDPVGSTDPVSSNDGESIDKSDTTTEYLLNHPWFIYHNEQISGYTDYDIYRGELLRLMDQINRLTEELVGIDKDHSMNLVNIIVGTPMENALRKKDIGSSFRFQFQQLFPVHIKDFVEYAQTQDTSSINVHLIIISPDRIFMDSYYQEPIFIEENEDFSFEKIANRKYVHQKGNVKIVVDIFACPFPQLDTRLDIIRKNNLFLEKVPLIGIKNFEPSPDDVRYIRDFYSKLEIIVGLKSSHIIVNSYATFRNACGYQNYGLFPSLLTFCNTHEIIATEWTFSEHNFMSRIVSNIKMTANYIDYLVSYIDPIYTPYYILDDYEDITLKEIKAQKLSHPHVCIKISFPYGNLDLKKIAKG